MDEDADGVVNVSHVMKVIKLLGTEKVKLSGKQINNIIDMLEKEEMLEVEANIERLLVRPENGNANNGELGFSNTFRQHRVEFVGCARDLKCPFCFILMTRVGSHREVYWVL